MVRLRLDDLLLAVHKAFIFAEVRETDMPLIELGRREVAARGLADVSEQEIVEWAEGTRRCAAV